MSATSPFTPAITLATGAILLILALLYTGTASAGEFCRNVPAEGGEAEACLALTPDTDSNPVGTDHTVTATGRLAGEPPETPVTLLFYVVGGPNAGNSLIADLDETGAATFTYTGDGGAGDDSIIAVVCDPDSCLEIQGCLDEDIGCLAKIESSCDLDNQAPVAPRMAAGGDEGNSFCFGPATAAKTWVDPTPTPVDVGAGGQEPSPSPTPAGLPDTGGPAGNDGNPWLFTAIAGAVLAAAATSLKVVRHHANR